MLDLVNMLLILVVLLDFFLLGSSRLKACIHVVAAQGAMLALLPLLTGGIHLHTLVFGGIALVLKGWLIPFMLLRAIREVRIRRDVEPIIGFVPTLLIGAAGTGAAFLFSHTLTVTEAHRGTLFIPVAVATLFTGLLLLLSRRKALTQVLGYLVLENGIYIFSNLLLAAMPVMVEAAILLDLLVAVFIMGIVIYQINRTFSSIDVEHLSALKE